MGITSRHPALLLEDSTEEPSQSDISDTALLEEARFPRVPSTEEPPQAASIPMGVVRTLNCASSLIMSLGLVPWNK